MKYSYALIPAALIGLRIFMGLLIVIGTYLGHSGYWLAYVYTFAFLTDILDGHFTRQLHCGSSQLCRWDAIADIILALSASYAGLTFYYQLLLPYFPYILGLILLQGFSWVLSLVKFGCMTSYHTWSAKMWALSLAGMFIFLFTLHSIGWTIILMLAIGVISNIEEIFITIILKETKSPVLSLYDVMKKNSEQKITGQP